ncbi:MAG: hypothetical protein MOGMAGMI_02234 [Candidatus Omnitrophica bacterium]|nr:hypothetical protein [Candidatus Omnitrophota bacterium]
MSSPDRYRILFERSSDAHFILIDGVITDCNDATVELLKCRSRLEVLSLHPSTLSPERQPDGRLSSEKSLEMDELARRNGSHRFEWVHRKTDGEEFPVEVTLNAVEIDGRPGLIAVWHDLTEHKLQEIRLKDLTREIEAKNLQLTAINERMRSELLGAYEVQRSLLPTQLPRSEKFECAWFFQPCEELAGDNLNAFYIDETRLGLYVLDVTGHGVASSLLSVTATHFLGSFAEAKCPLKVIERLNGHFSRETYTNHVFTIVYGVLDLTTQEFTYVSAGHPGPLWLKNDGTAVHLPTQGIPIGLFPDATYTKATVRLEPGDRIFLFSDGIYEVRDGSGEDLGLERVSQRLLRDARDNMPLDYLVHSLMKDVYHGALPGKPDDDISVLALETKNV